ncbi:protein SRC2-like [Cocos nucifera]|uniref:Protein SRC2-like n=1 Tax=Cocos nucifera TaxID=13894 RepID=A0A8K0J0P7_COCNU|nr:protein SRC2-like [Cocos nucifera]
MAYRTLEITLISAKDLNQVKLFSKMDVYAVVSLSGDPRSRQRTPPDREGDRNPTWNSTFRFNVPADNYGRQVLHILLRAERARGDRDVGQVHVPLSELLNAAGPDFRSYKVRRCTSGDPKGVLNLSYKIHGQIAAPPSAYCPHPSGVPMPDQQMLKYRPYVTQPYPPQVMYPGCQAPPHGYTPPPHQATPVVYPGYQPPPHGYAPPLHQATHGYTPAGYVFAPLPPRNESVVHMVTASFLGGASHALGAAISQMAFNDAGNDAGSTGF